MADQQQRLGNINREIFDGGASQLVSDHLKT
jgi:hypothetical protein